MHLANGPQAFGGTSEHFVIFNVFLVAVIVEHKKRIYIGINIMNNT